MLSQADVIWISAVVSAVIAGVVTLAIEYAAKPWLEARKDRITEQSKMRRDAIRDLQHVSALTGGVMALGDKLDERFSDEKLMAHVTELQPLMHRVFEEMLPYLPKRLMDDWVSVTVKVDEFAYAVAR